MALPRTLKYFNVFNEGSSCLGEVDKITLPKLARKMEEWQGGGMLAPVKLDYGMQGLEMEHTYGGLMPQILAQFGVMKHDGVLLRFVGAYQREDTSAIDAVEITVRGRHEEIDMGDAKQGDKTETKVKSALSYYKMNINGTTVIEIDVVNMISIINGVDMLAAIRTAIGL